METDPRPSAEACLEAWLELLDVSVELAIAGIMQADSVSREEAIRRLDARFREEADRDRPALIRMARGRGRG